MEQQSFSHGLLYSVSPEDFQKLHLQDDADTEEWNWVGTDSVVQTISSFFKRVVVKLRHGESAE